MNNQRFYMLLLYALILASFFHIQYIVLLIALVILGMPLKRHFAAFQTSGIFWLLLIPALIGLIAGYRNDTYLIFKDLYYLSLPVILITSGILLACRMEIQQFLKTIVIAGVIISVLVTCISVYYMGPQALADPYSAHYVIGIVGTPAPPLALGCLLLCYKLDIKLFSRQLSVLFSLVNCLGIYMFASRTYLIITGCFVLLPAFNYLKRPWFLAITTAVVLITAMQTFSSFQTHTSESFTGKIVGSFAEISLGNYDTEQDINTRYRGYESFMALKGYSEGSVKDWLAGGLGKLIDLKTFVKLGEDTEYQYIPILHNGWLYVLIKTGIIGVVFYLSLFIKLLVVFCKNYFHGNAKPAIRLFSALSVGCILGLLLTNYIVSAFFSVEMSILMITAGYSYLNFHALVFEQQKRQPVTPGFTAGLKTSYM